HLPRHFDRLVDGMGTGNCPEVVTKLSPTQQLRQSDYQTPLPGRTGRPDDPFGNVYSRAVRIRVQLRPHVVAQPSQQQLLRWPWVRQIPAGGWRLHLDGQACAYPFEVRARDCSRTFAKEEEGVAVDLLVGALHGRFAPE